MNDETSLSLGSLSGNVRRLDLGAPRFTHPLLPVLMALAKRIRVGHCTLILPGRRVVTIEGPDAPAPRVTLQIHRLRCVRRLLIGGDLGFAEAYIDGDWDTPDLRAFLDFAAANEAAIGKVLQGSRPARWANRLRHLLRPNTRRGSRRNIASHYDISNAFYSQWLDATMTYSSAVFTAADEDLSAAQERKYRQLAEMARLGSGMHVLEIGCGWGAFAMLAARDYGCRVTALTVSREQFDFARQRVDEAGLADRIDVRLQDYRDVGGAYDRIVSIEMFEAVGEAYWPTYFDVLRQRLRPGGSAALQIISIADDRFESYRRGADFIQRYIFAGGMLPSPSALTRQVARAGLAIVEQRRFGSSYAETLARWSRRFDERWPQIGALGFDERFRRMWSYYLAYCEAGFRSGVIDVAHYRIDHASPPGNSG